MHALIVLALVGVAGGITYLIGGTRAGFFKGQTRTISFPDGSKPEHLSRLRVLFSKVVDRGNGVYEVTADFDGNVSLPSGAKIAGVSESVGATVIVLYAIFHKGKHIGFAFGPGAAKAITRVLTNSVAQRSSQTMPKVWASSWRPVWGNSEHTTIWGRFLSPYSTGLPTLLQWAGYPADASSSNYGSTQNLLAMRDY